MNLFFNRKKNYRNSNKKIYYSENNISFQYKNLFLPFKNFKENSNFNILQLINKIALRSTKIFIIFSFTLYISKYIFMYIRLYHKQYLKEFSIAQKLGFAHLSDYEEYNRKEPIYECREFPNYQYRMVYKDKTALNSFIQIFDKYLKHPKFGEYIGKFLLDAVIYKPKYPPKQDFIQILNDEFIESDDFYMPLLKNFRSWFLSEEIINYSIDIGKKAFFSDELLAKAIELGKIQFWNFVAIREIRIFIEGFIQHYSKYENTHNSALNVSSIDRFDSVIDFLESKHLYYAPVQYDAKSFKLKDYNHLFLDVAYTWLHEKVYVGGQKYGYSFNRNIQAHSKARKEIVETEYVSSTP